MIIIMNTIKPVSPGVKNLLTNNRVAEPVFFHLALRHNNANETLTSTCENLLRRQEVTRPEITQLWKQLEEEGCGRFIKGSRGRKSRFQWLVHTREFCGAAILSL